MTTTAGSIDAAANGYIRLRFMRALNASFAVLLIFTFIALTVGPTASAVSTGEWDQMIGAPLGAFLVLLFLLLPTMALIGVIGAISDTVHRRIVALALLIGSVAVGIFLSVSLLSLIMALAGVEMVLGEGSATPPNHAALTLLAVVGVLISYQLARHAWWQLTARSVDYRATRGWRPPPWRIMTSFRRYLGLPSFVANVGTGRLGLSMLYFGVAVLNLGLAMLVMLPIFLTSAGEQNVDFDPTIAVGVMVALLLLNLVGAGSLLSRLADARATKLYQNVREWDARAPIVFLRAFDQDSARLKAKSGDGFARWPAGVGRQRTLDEIILEHGSPYGPVIAIGDPRDPTPPLGAARVFVPEAGNGWQDVVRGLVGASKAVVMCPNHGEGVQWELDLIAQAGGRLQVIFLASPELDREHTLALFKHLVADMPEIDTQQQAIAAYELDGVWRVLTTRRLSVDSYTAALNTALQALFGLKGEPVKRPKKSVA